VIVEGAFTTRPDVDMDPRDDTSLIFRNFNHYNRICRMRLRKRALRAGFEEPLAETAPRSALAVRCRRLNRLHFRFFLFQQKRALTLTTRRELRS